MPTTQRYVVFAIIDLLLAGWIFYRSIYPALAGVRDFSTMTYVNIVLVVLLVGIAGRFAYQAINGAGNRS